MHTYIPYAGGSSTERGAVLIFERRESNGREGRVERAGSLHTVSQSGAARSSPGQSGARASKREQSRRLACCGRGVLGETHVCIIVSQEAYSESLGFVGGQPVRTRRGIRSTGLERTCMHARARKAAKQQQQSNISKATAPCRQGHWSAGVDIGQGAYPIRRAGWAKRKQTGTVQLALRPKRR